MSGTMNVGEFGKYIYANTNYDMSGFTALTMTITRKDGTIITRTNPAVSISASAYVSADLGTFTANQYMIYKVQAGDLTVPGEYLVRLKYNDSEICNIATASFTVNP